MNASSNANAALLRHFVATLRYRADLALRDAPATYPEVESGNGIRTPRAILAHISDVLTFALRRLGGEDDFAGLRSEPQHWDDEIGRFHEVLDRLHHVLTSPSELSDERARRLLQGPLSDAMTHIGQLALIRRAAGSPIPGHDFFDAPIG